MQTGGVFIQTNQISRMTGGGQQVLKEGSQVLVRVIADRGGGRYEGSVAGVRVNLQSSKPLTLGQTFLASISAKDGTVYITPKEINLFSRSGLQVNVMQNEHLAAVLSQLGLPADTLSEHLFMQFKQFGLRLDSTLMQKIRSMALKFGGKQKSAVELLAVLKEKGLDISEEDLLKLLSELDVYERNSSEQPDEQTQRNKDNKFEMLNKVNSTKGKWFLLPFEISQNDAILGVGNIRLLLENEMRLKFMNVECLYNARRYLFNLEFENKHCRKIRFNVDGAEDSESSGYISRLKSKIYAVQNGISGVEIEWCPAELIDGTACELETLQTVGGNA